MIDMKRERKARYTRVLAVLGFQSLVAIALFLVGAWRNHSSEYWYLIWNLFLAWLPLVFAFTLSRFLKKRPWVSWQGVLLSILWLGFLPNSFYMLSDFIHLGGVVRVDLVFDVIMFSSFAITGLTLGFTSLYLIHIELLKRIRFVRAHLTIAVVLLLCGFAIYLGRNLRWNSWDILVNPSGILFSVSDPILDPGSQPETFSTTFGFFALLGSIYAVAWNYIQVLRHADHS
jgi:uncharacterized membrane protein